MKERIPWNKGKRGLQVAWNKGKKSPWTSKRNKENNPMKDPEIKKRAGLNARGIKKPKISESNKRRVGELAAHWKGGLTPLVLQIRHCFKYRQWRSDVFTRDDFACIMCGNRGVYIEADHYPKRFSDIFYENGIKTIEQALNCEEFWNINNGRTLCRECHNKTKGK